MADTTEKEAKISIKVIVDKVNSRVVYAEGNYTFVDILFSFITMPMGTIVRLLRKHDDKMFKALGSLDNLYQSLEDFPECYLSTEKCKDLLLNPRCLAYDHCKNLKLKIDDTKLVSYFGCSYYGNSSSRKLVHPNVVMSREPFCNGLKRPRVSSCDGVFVSDIANFIITDDLCVEPYSSASSIRLLAELGITDMNQLEERNLEMSSYQMLSFLNLALTTNCPLTYFVFSKINPIRRFFVSGQHNTFDQSFDLLKKEVSANSRMVVEVTRQKSTKRLLFAEAKEDFVEFLFGILSIPLGTVVGTLMNGASSVSCMDNIFESISNMSVGRCLMTQGIKNMLLKPHIGQEYASKHHMFPLNVVKTLSTHYIGHRPNEGYLKQSGLFIVTDDLTITMSSSFSIFNILKKSKVSPEDIERCEVSIGLKEGLSMLKAMLRSSSTLTDSLEFQLMKK